MSNLLGAALFFSVALSATAAERCRFRVHLATNANGGAVFAQSLRSSTGKSERTLVDQRVLEGRIYLPSDLNADDHKLMVNDRKLPGG